MAELGWFAASQEGSVLDVFPGTTHWNGVTVLGVAVVEVPSVRYVVAVVSDTNADAETAV